MNSKIAFRDAILRPKSPPRLLGALERMSECSQDALGTFQERSWDVPGMLQSAIGTFFNVLGTLLEPLGASWSRHGSTF